MGSTTESSQKTTKSNEPLIPPRKLSDDLNKDLQLAPKIIQSLKAQIKILDEINKHLNEPTPNPPIRNQAFSESKEIMVTY